MVTFLNGKMGVRVGSGDCAPMATEALRVSGAEFYPGDLGPDTPTSGDYVWGTLITVISYTNNVWSDSAPTVAVLPGDVIQYGGGAKFGKTLYPTRHTSVVQTVNAATANRPTAVFQQNFGGVRSVQCAAIDTTQLIGGWLRIYRPVPRQDAPNQWKVTVVNNSSSSQTYQVMVGTTSLGSVSATAANSSGSYFIHKLATDGTVPCIVLSSGPSLYLINGCEFAIYNLSKSKYGLQQLSP
jgi:hypothetical protein